MSVGIPSPVPSAGMPSESLRSGRARRAARGLRRKTAIALARDLDLQCKADTATTEHEDEPDDDEAMDATAEGEVTSVAAVVVVGGCCGVGAGGGADTASSVFTLTECCIEFGS